MVFMVEFRSSRSQRDHPPLPPELVKLEPPGLLEALKKWLRARSRTANELASAYSLLFSTDALIASHVNAPDRIARWLIRADLYSYIAEIPNTPQHVLRALAEWGEACVATNRAAGAISLRTLHLLHPGVADAEVAANPSCPPDVLAGVAKSKDPKDQDSGLPALVGNPSSPEEAPLAVATCKCWNDLFVYGDTGRKLISHPNSTGRVLDVLIAKNRVDLDSSGARVARDTRLSVASYEWLARVRDAAVRKQFAANPAISTDLLTRLSVDKNESLKKAALRAGKQREKGTAP